MDDMKEVLDKLGQIVDTQTEHTGTLKLILDASKSHLSSISANTEKMADSLVGMKESNEKLADYATGKKQVPLSIFVLIVSTVLILWMSDRFARSWESARISAPGASIELHHHEEAK